ncbi:hypothetical protein B0T16DRAFT_16453 [Cercophora newfieldiana]|uniref:Uncharacterized protein n=1 Tax=Cercophora newfieldiana TaxID=92897 RepID=A0AA39YQ33_9PEZI|nr:hypothetical protein B0T16DRAFT_16453 [Cercophora newfieldiana]
MCWPSFSAFPVYRFGEIHSAAREATIVDQGGWKDALIRHKWPKDRTRHPPPRSEAMVPVAGVEKKTPACAGVRPLGSHCLELRRQHALTPMSVAWVHYRISVGVQSSRSITFYSFVFKLSLLSIREGVCVSNSEKAVPTSGSRDVHIARTGLSWELDIDRGPVMEFPAKYLAMASLCAPIACARAPCACQSGARVGRRSGSPMSRWKPCGSLLEGFLTTPHPCESVQRTCGLTVSRTCAAAQPYIPGLKASLRRHEKREVLFCVYLQGQARRSHPVLAAMHRNVFYVLVAELGRTTKGSFASRGPAQEYSTKPFCSSSAVSIFASGSARAGFGILQRWESPYLSVSFAPNQPDLAFFRLVSWSPPPAALVTVTSRIHLSPS